jgi:hypothetical protein
MAVQLPEEERIRHRHDDLELRFMQQHLTLRSSIGSVGTVELSTHIPFYILPLLDISQWRVTKLSTCLPEIIFQKKALFCCYLQDITSFSLMVCTCNWYVDERTGSGITVFAQEVVFCSLAFAGYSDVQRVPFL